MNQSPDSNGRFVVQKHHARTLHYDFRLEREGVFKSWAVPKGVPETIGTRRLAVQVPDHALEFGSFEGTIPEGEYGAETVEIWDEGTFDLLEWTADAIGFVLHGRR
jgi:bifunctional non-homologous end joining protein LigD